MTGLFHSVLKYSSLFSDFFPLRFLAPSRRPLLQHITRVQTTPAAAGGRPAAPPVRMHPEPVTIHSLMILSLHRSSCSARSPTRSPGALLRRPPRSALPAAQVVPGREIIVHTGLAFLFLVCFLSSAMCSGHSGPRSRGLSLSSPCPPGSACWVPRGQYHADSSVPQGPGYHLAKQCPGLRGR